MRRLKKLLYLLLIISAGYWLLQKVKLIPSLGDIFKEKPVVIDKTPILIKEIKSIGQLITYSAFDEVVADSLVATKASSFINSFNRLAPLPVLPNPDRQLVIIGRGKILAGTDLTRLNDSSVTIKNDTINVYLPKAIIIDAILNPSDFETFVEKGDWSGEEVTLVKGQARRKMIERAISQNILQKADDKSRILIENFLRNMGYKNVYVFSR